MKSYYFMLIAVFVAALNTASAQENDEQTVLQLSKDKWQWMANKNVAALEKLFDAKSMFVHMGGSWGKEQELNIIKSGGIHYKKRISILLL